MNRPPIVLGVSVLMAGSLSATSFVRAMESSELASTQNATGESFWSDACVLLRLPFQTNENFSFGAVSEVADEDSEADKLAKQLANPIASLISVPFQANEDWGYGPNWGMRFNFTLLYPTGKHPEAVERTSMTK